MIRKQKKDSPWKIDEKTTIQLHFSSNLEVSGSSPHRERTPVSLLLANLSSDSVYLKLSSKLICIGIYYVKVLA